MPPRTLAASWRAACYAGTPPPSTGKWTGQISADGASPPRHDGVHRAPRRADQGAPALDSGGAVLSPGLRQLAEVHLTLVFLSRVGDGPPEHLHRRRGASVLKIPVSGVQFSPCPPFCSSTSEAALPSPNPDCGHLVSIVSAFPEHSSALERTSGRGCGWLGRGPRGSAG
jgi:hypothetical protein